MTTFSTYTISELIKAHQFRAQVEIEEFARRFGLAIQGQSVNEMEWDLARYLIKNPDVKGPNGGPLVFEIVTQLLADRNGDGAPEERSPDLVHALARDAFEISQGGVRWSLHQALKNEETNLRSAFLLAEQRLPPARDEAEEKKRSELILLGITTAGIGALVDLRQRHPARYRQIVRAALLYTEDRIMKRPARFQIRALNKDDRFWGRARNLSLQAAHQFLLRRLRDALKTQATTPLVKSAPRPEAGSMRYDKAQREGFRRREQSVQLRAQAVCDIAAELLKGQMGGIVPEQALTLEDARRWVRNGNKPAQISRQILALWCGESPRRIKEILDKATRQRKEAEKVHRNLDLRGYARLDS